MKLTPLEIPDVLLIEPKVFGDDRGFFYESFNHNLFSEKSGLTPNFAQDNHSRSSQHVLRGLHYQLPPHAQAKLVRVTRGKVFDVAVDIRKSSPTFGKWVGEILSEDNHRQLFIPEGFAHGFYVLSEVADFLYKASNYYNKEAERELIWNDSDLAIEWPLIGTPEVSEKDKLGKSFAEGEFFS